MSNEPFREWTSIQSMDSLPIRTAPPEVLDMEKVVTHIAGAVQRGRYRGPTNPQDYLFEKQCLAHAGSETFATLAGVLCFGKNPQQVLQRAVVDLGHYRALEPVSYEVIHLEKDIGGTIFEQIDRVESYLWTNTHHGMTIVDTSVQRVEVHEYPKVVIRELIVNMLAHRDYTKMFIAARVHLFRNRIEWVSPGSLPDGVTIETLLSEQCPRNPVILSILYEAGYVEAFGQGLDTVVAVLKQEQMLPPRFENTPGSFIVTVYGRPLDRLYGLNSDSLILNTTQRQILLYLQSRGDASPGDLRDQFPDRPRRSLQRDLKGLIDANLINAIGETRSLHYRLREPGE